MKPIRAILAGMLAVFCMQPILGNADDIDIYSGLGTTGNVPNVMIVLDNAANNNADAGYTCVMDGTPSALGTKLLAVEQCALYYVVKDLPVGADGAALVNVGVMMFNANNMTDVAGLNCAATSSAGGCLVHPLTPLGKDSAGVDQKPAYLAWIKSWNAPSGPNIIANNANTGGSMQETWAYYSGSIGLSGRDYSSIKPASGCQKNFVIFIGNAYNSVGSPNDQTGVQAKLENAPGVTTEQKQQILDTVKTVSCLGPGGTTAFTFPSSNHEQGGYYADEWARYMYQSDLYSATGEPTGRQSITTYSIGVHNPGCKQAYEATLFNMAHYGGGKYFATNDYSSVVQAILKILNEVQAVNSVFSSSSLPVSVNAQGTYLNQVYMGMFRPDPGALPRWAGNLKQYKFIINPASGDLQLGDSVGEPAIDASGTGFLSPNAISYWTCSDPSNPFLTGVNQVSGLPNVTAAQLSLLTSQGQICANDPDSGFWANFNSMMNSAGKAFDMVDGELVEKGGAAQRIRLDNLTDDYAANPSSPRNLYTYCPSGTSCNADLTNAANAFSTSNANIAATLFGTDASVNISALSRSGTTVTVTTSGVHGFATNDAITIANASPADYNGTYTIAVTDTNHFTYQIVEYPPLAVSPTGPTNFTAAPTTGGVDRTVSSLVRIGNTARVTTSVAHGFPNGTSVVISGASPSAYNGSFTISNVTADTFDYVLNERPPLVAGGGKVTITYKEVGAGCPCTVAANINAWNAALPGIQRSLGSTTITVNTDTDMVNSPSWVGKTFAITNALDSFGLSVPEYNVSGTIVSVSGNSFTFTLATALTPSSPATGTLITASGVVPKTIENLIRVGSTAFATVTGHGFAGGSSVSIGSTIPKPTESGYVGIFNITLIDANNFSYPIVTTPSTPATGVGGVAMTATRSTGFAASDMSSLINWVRGEDSYGDETSLCPPGSTPGVDNCPATRVTVRPSVHGDVLHSRPTVLNYGGLTIDILATSDSGGVRTATASTTDVDKIGATGATANFKFASGNTCAVTVDSATTFTYSASNCGASGAQTVVTDTSNVVVYYGDNGGVFHAVNGNQVNPAGSTLPAPGVELWGLILKEHFTKLNRLRTNAPQLNLPSTPPAILPTPKSKDYFVDGLTGVYQLVDAQGTTLAAHLYLSMRRGGRMIYAMDVTDPQLPRFLWKVDNTTANMSELGQTWSTPKVARVAGYSNPVLIFGAGYDTNQDTDPPTAADSMGRGIFILDAITGALVWKASYDSAASSGSSTWTSTGTTTQATCLSDKLRYSIPSDITLMDRNRDGYIDRLYVADLGGQVWRVDLEPGNTAITPPYNHVTPDNWKLHRLASLGECGTAVCRKFFFPPEVINTTGYDAVILGSGDREHPLYNNTAATGKQNMVFLLKDTYTGNDATGMTRIRLADSPSPLFNATSTAYDGSLSGYYINLADGEKVVNAPLVTAGYVFFGTNQPTAPSTTSCTSSLGTARGYRLSPFTASYQSVIFAGGGLPPSPVSGVVNITTASGETELVPFLIGGGNPECTGADCASALGGQKPPIAVSTSRIRTYWYKKGK